MDFELEHLNSIAVATILRFIRYVSDMFSERYFSSVNTKWCDLQEIRLHDSITKTK